MVIIGWTSLMHDSNAWDLGWIGRCLPRVLAVVGRLGDVVPLVGDVAVEIDTVGVLVVSAACPSGLMLSMIHKSMSGGIGIVRIFCVDQVALGLVAVDHADQQHRATARGAEPVGGDVSTQHSLPDQARFGHR